MADILDLDVHQEDMAIDDGGVEDEGKILSFWTTSSCRSSVRRVLIPCLTF